MNEQPKLKGILQSRKFWAAVVSLLVTFGVVGMDVEDQVTDAIVTIVPVVAGSAYIIGTAIEDAGHARAENQDNQS